MIIRVLLYSAWYVLNVPNFLIEFTGRVYLDLY